MTLIRIKFYFVTKKIFLEEMAVQQGIQTISQEIYLENTYFFKRLL